MVFVHSLASGCSTLSTSRLLSVQVFQSFSTAFDAAFEEIWLAFSAGATLVCATAEMMKSGADLVDTLRALHITVLDTTPTNLGILGAPKELPEVHTIIVGGEACPGHVVDAWQPGRRFLNTYGPTETTVVASWAELFSGAPVTIGKAMPHYRLSVRDEQMAEVEPGDEGELVIGGPGVAKGYLNLPEQTQEKFITLPGIGRCYRSGDIVKEDVEACSRTAPPHPAAQLQPAAPPPSSLGTCAVRRATSCTLAERMHRSRSVAIVLSSRTSRRISRAWAARSR